MRKTIAIEGRSTVPEQFLEVGCLKWDEEKPTPIVWNFMFEKTLGWAKDFRREEDGTITAELDITDENAAALFEHGDIVATFYADQLDINIIKDDDGKRISHSYKSARIRAISLVISGMVPWS